MKRVIKLIKRALGLPIYVPRPTTSRHSRVERAGQETVKRLARGNILLQSGRFDTREDIDQLRERVLGRAEVNIRSTGWGEDRAGCRVGGGSRA